mgnify:CR=1 FL=1|tara:strand:+ start:624 stop:2288 length:1665 start_codon:yes stop_codon:yes gene_type:complete
MTKARDIADFKFEDIVDTGTAGTKVASGTTAQRGSTTGQWRYNTTTGFFEGRNTDGSFSTLEPTPTIISTDVTDIDTQVSGNITIRVTGTNFTTGGTIKFIANDATEVTATTSTFVNSSNYDAVVARSSFTNAKEPYDVRFVSSSGLQATLDNHINVDSAPVWSTAAGSLGNVTVGESASKTVTATDADGDTIAYSKVSGGFPTGMSLNTSTGVISGTVSGGASTYNFDMRATAGSKTTDRSFSIISIVPATGGNSIVTYSYGGVTYKMHIFTGNGTFTRESISTADVLVVGGGGGGGFGGGGAGALVWGTSKTLSDATYAVTIGGAGSGTVSGAGHTTNGADSSFGSLVVAEGGGSGGRIQGKSGGNLNSGDGSNGGSGGGAGHPNTGDTSSANGGSAITGNSTGGTIYGNAGGNGYNCCNGGGGGGAGGAGQNGVGDPGSGENVGGNGHSTFVGDAASTAALLFAADLGTDGSGNPTSGLSSNPNTLYLAGGGGGAYGSPRGGYGGGGTGGVSSGNTSGVTAGLVNSGSGGGASNGQGQNGGTGVVLVRYAI